VKSTVTAVVAVLAVGVLLVGGFLVLQGDGSEERREARKTAQQAGPAGRCAPQSEEKAKQATRAFLDEFLQEDGQGSLKGVGPTQIGGGWVLFVSTGNESPLAQEPDCYMGVPVRYQRTPPDIPTNN
jgi:hypothetical protein